MRNICKKDKCQQHLLKTISNKTNTKQIYKYLKLSFAKITNSFHAIFVSTREAWGNGEKNEKIKSLVIPFIALSMMLFVSSIKVNAIDSQNYLSSLSSAEIETAEKESEALNLADDIKSVYSDQDYGGMYIDSSGTLNVYIMPQKLRNSIQTITNYNDNLKIYKGTYSLSELKNSVDAINEVFMKYNLTSGETYIDESTNSVIVNLLKDDVYPSEVTKLLDSNIYGVNYIANGIIANDEVAVGSGAAGYSSGSVFSVTFMAKRGSTVGFITAGHCIKSGGILTNSSGTQMGKGTVGYDSGDTDAAFVSRTNTSFTPTSTATYSKQVLNGTYPSFIIQGATVNVEGHSSGSKSGTITSTYSSVGNATGRIKTSYSSTGGDSGGTMWVGRFIDGTSVYGRYIVGIHNGSYLNSAGTRLGAYGTRIDTALNKLGITYYGN